MDELQFRHVKCSRREPGSLLNAVFMVMLVSFHATLVNVAMTVERCPEAVTVEQQSMEVWLSRMASVNA